ncbi:MAG: DUF6603 domain-containing protein [bacterium]
MVNPGLIFGLEVVVADIPIRLNYKNGDLEGEVGSSDNKIDNNKLSKFVQELNLGGLPEGIEIPEISIERLNFKYSQKSKDYRITITVSCDDISLNFKLLVKEKKEGGPENEKNPFVLGLNCSQIDLSTLALDKFPLLQDLADISLNQIGFLYSNSDIDDDDGFFGFNKISKINKGFSPTATIKLYDDIILQLPEKEAEKAEKVEKESEEERPQKLQSYSEETNGSEISKPFRKWFPVNKTFGPIHIGRIGCEWRENKLGFLLDTDVDLMGLTVGLNGFRISLQLFEFINEPKLGCFEIGLDGLDISFSGGPVEISADLLKTSEGEDTEYTGMAQIKAKAFTISGIGSFAMTDGETPSLFIFALLNKDLGGPTFFHVTGLAAGFGFNRTLKLPEIEQVQDFPLIKAVMDPDYFKAGSGEGGNEKENGSKAGAGMIKLQESALEKLQDWISPAQGEYWLAAGVRFTSFEMIESFALLLVAFGTDTVISVLGMSKITIPKPPKNGQGSGTPIAYAELVIKATFKPESGIFKAEGRLKDNSYILSKDCKLTGGFAYYAWFAGEHADDFVITLGGYHPRFNPPKHYPIVPRLAIKWQVSSNLKITGELYFALTPACIMAGGKLNAVYQAGSIRAWFTAYADLLISWKPLYYDITIGINIGVSYRLSTFGISKTLKTELGAQVHIWGPPFDGKAHINWHIISFTIYFGKGRREFANQPILWDEFCNSFLPRENHEDKADPITIMIADGIISEVKDGEDYDYTIVNPHHLVVIVKSAIPSTRIDTNIKDIDENYYGTDGMDDRPEPKFGIRPMGLESISSEKIITLSKINSNGNDIVALKSEEIRQNVPDALWSPHTFDPGKDEPKADLIKNVLCGIQLSAKEPELKDMNEVTIPDLNDLYTPISLEFDWKYPSAKNAGAYEPENVIPEIRKPEINDTRKKILWKLIESGIFEPQANLDMKKIPDTFANMVFQAIPVECGLGMLPQEPNK